MKFHWNNGPYWVNVTSGRNYPQIYFSEIQTGNTTYLCFCPTLLTWESCAILDRFVLRLKPRKADSADGIHPWLLKVFDLALLITVSKSILSFDYCIPWVEISSPCLFPRTIIQNKLMTRRWFPGPHVLEEYWKKKKTWPFCRNKTNVLVLLGQSLASQQWSRFS